ncbi:MAG: GTPase HflX [Planctomycetes bacterium]|nr:GTPase HflX [Planctomycetota bacterium]
MERPPSTHRRGSLGGKGGALSKVGGDLTGLKKSERSALERLYRRRIDPDQAATPELIRELATRAAGLGRRLGLLLDRRGSVTHVFVGQRKSIEIPALGRQRRGAGRLKGLRWLVTTHREDPSLDDLNALVRNRFDLLLRIGVGEEGEATFLQEVHLAPAQEDGSGAHVVGPRTAPNAVRRDLTLFLRELERAFEEATPPAQRLDGRELEPALLVVVASGAKPARDQEENELRELAQGASLDVKGILRQRLDRPNPHTLLGKGKVSDLAALALTTNAKVVCFGVELAPRQQVALEDLLGGVRVIDRTQLILELFAQRARTHAGKLQVEVARLRYQLPRLLGRGEGMTRIGGGKGAGFGRTKGSGEKKLEVDRRRIRDRISQMERELTRLGRQRGLRRQRRAKNRLPHVALVGYTNVGKSTLFNRLTGAKVVTKDQVFASLDPTLRQRRLPKGRRVVLSDTVGFIRRLPKDLLKAFSATLDEIEGASLLVHVADASDPHTLGHLEAVRGLLKDLGRGEIPELLCFNKADLLEDPDVFRPLANRMGRDPLLISATEGNLDALLERIEAELHEHAPELPDDELTRSEGWVSEDELSEE